MLDALWQDRAQGCAIRAKPRRKVPIFRCQPEVDYPALEHELHGVGVAGEIRRLNAPEPVSNLGRFAVAHGQ